MDEIDQGTRPKRTRVLRATDIIPPFDHVPVPADTGGPEPEPLEPAIPEPVQADEYPDATGSEETVIADQTEADLPRYDLAENILAEQRRVASRRRRAPSQPHEEPATPEPQKAESSAIELPCEDLPELQRVVAEIVAKDIERLCRKPNAN